MSPISWVNIKNHSSTKNNLLNESPTHCHQHYGARAPDGVGGRFLPT